MLVLSNMVKWSAVVCSMHSSMQMLCFYTLLRYMSLSCLTATAAAHPRTDPMLNVGTDIHTSIRTTCTM